MGDAIFYTITMSENEQLQIAKLIDKEIEQKRRAAWSGFGVELYYGEIALQLRAQEIANKLIDPQTIQQIQETETALAIVKKELNDLIEERKTKYTARFISVTKRLMTPENSVEAAIKLNEAALLKAKLEKKEADKTAENKEKELKGIAEHVRVYVADMHAAYLKMQLKLINDAYVHALEKEIPVAGIQDYIKKVSLRINEASSTTPLPRPVFKYNTQADVDAEITKQFNPWQPQKYIDGFTLDIQAKFADWELALKNKEQAAKINTEEFNATTDAIDDNKEKETVAAKLDAIAMPVAEVSAGKQLKQVYKIAEPQTIEEANIIIAAYLINQKECMPELRKIKAINFGVKQMISALENIKNNDENFSVTGITFTQIEKL